MLKYIYNAKQRDGSLVKGEIEASDTNDFLIKLKDMQLYCFTASAIKLLMILKITAILK